MHPQQAPLRPEIAQRATMHQVCRLAPVIRLWEQFRDREISLPTELETELRVREPEEGGEVGPADDGLTAEDLLLIETAGLVASETWFSLAAWAKQTQTLQPWQRSLAFSLGRLAGRQKPPSIKQATQGMRILDEAKKLGFGT